MQWQEECHKFQVSKDYVVRLSLQNAKQNFKNIFFA